jgi:hypothetical protein
MMKRVAWLAAAAALCAACSHAPPKETGWRSLFDGKTLNGWTPKIRGFPLGENYRDTFRVADGALVVSYDKYDEGKFGERFGHIFYKSPFSAYRLRLEYRFSNTHPPDTPAWAIANNGVMVFSQDPKTMAVGDSFPVSVEAQILGEAPGQVRFNGNMCSPGTNVVMEGKLVTTHCINSKTPAAPNETWVRFEVEVKPNGEVIERQNGVDTITYSGVQLDPRGDMADSKPLVAAAGGKLELTGGWIALQSEGAPIAFRNIEILELR